MKSPRQKLSGSAASIPFRLRFKFSCDFTLSRKLATQSWYLLRFTYLGGPWKNVIVQAGNSVPSREALEQGFDSRCLGSKSTYRLSTGLAPLHALPERACVSVAVRTDLHNPDLHDPVQSWPAEAEVDF